MEGFILNIAHWKLCPSPFLGDFDQFFFQSVVSSVQFSGFTSM